MSLDPYAINEAHRLIANLIRVGVVTELDAENARVKVRVGGFTTDWLPWATQRAGATRTWSAPRAGEQVVLLSPYGDPGQGVVLTSIYQEQHPAPANSQDVEHTVYPDGTTIDYNSKENTYTMTVAGNARVVVNCKEATVNAENSVVANTKTAEVKASTSVTLDTPDTFCKGRLTVDGLLTYKDGMRGSTGSGKAAIVDGDIQFIGGSLTHQGKNIGNTHTHSGVRGGPDTSGAVS